MSEMMRCNTLQEAVEFLKNEHTRCAVVAAYLYAAGVDKVESRDALIAAGFDEEAVQTCLDTLYTVVTTSAVDRLRSLHLLLEAEQTPGS